MDRSFGAVVFSREGTNTRYLLVLHGRGGHWGLPKGHPLPGETPGETALREVFEETGWRIRLVAGFLEAVQYTLPSGERKQVEYFLAEAVASETRLAVDPLEITRIEWLPRDTARDRITHDDVKTVLDRADRFLTKKV
jgi:bis(5'-nucleosidyl)-tetraphosphatase